MLFRSIIGQDRAGIFAEVVQAGADGAAADGLEAARGGGDLRGARSGWSVP